MADHADKYTAAVAAVVDVCNFSLGSTAHHR